MFYIVTTVYCIKLGAKIKEWVPVSFGFRLLQKLPSMTKELNIVFKKSLCDISLLLSVDKNVTYILV